jgi:hypothetical protein
VAIRSWDRFLYRAAPGVLAKPEPGGELEMTDLDHEKTTVA